MKTNETESERQRRWQAEDDARTLAAYQEIISDPKRVKHAAKVASQQAADLQKKANAMKKIANKGKK
jgi:hypothetical protein